MEVRSCWRYVLCLVVLALAGCSAANSPSTPTASTTGAPRTYEVSLGQTWMLDLDSGWLGARASADVWFEAVSGSERYFSPTNGARMALAGTTAPGLKGCVAATLTFSRLPIASLTAGRYLCVYTTEYRWAEVRIDDAAPEPVAGSSTSPALKMTVTVH